MYCRCQHIDTRLRELPDSSPSADARQVGSASFDKDDYLAVDFVTAASNLRSNCYGIPEQVGEEGIMVMGMKATALPHSSGDRKGAVVSIWAPFSQDMVPKGMILFLGGLLLVLRLPLPPTLSAVAVRRQGHGGQHRTCHRHDKCHHLGADCDGGTQDSGRYGESSIHTVVERRTSIINSSHSYVCAAFSWA